MPLYDYLCTTCGKTFEVSQRMSDPALTHCQCGAKGTVKRQLNAGSGLIFKGSGFYITDYKNNGGGAKGGDSKPSESKPASESAAPSCGAGACPACAD
jgi:putative FmdB family regulatory protein